MSRRRIQLPLVVLAVVVIAIACARSSFAASDAGIAFVTTRDSGEIYTMEADGSGEARVTRRDPGGFGPAWSPDGSTIAFTGFADDGWANLWAMGRDGSDPHALVGLRWLAGPAFDPDWSPSGGRLVFSQEFDIYTARADGTGLRRLTDRGGIGHDDWDPAWSPSGRAITFTRDGRIYRMRPDGTRLRRLGRGDEADWSPSGRRIVFAVWQANGRRDLYVMDADSTDRRRLTRTRADESRPAWSPGGGKIAFSRGRSLWVMDPDGSDARRIIRRAGAPAWSPDGSFLAFSRGRTTEHVGEEEHARAIFTMRRDGSAITRLLTPAFDRDVAPSPDGTRIAFTSVRPFSRSGVYVAEAGGTNEAFLHTGSSPAWSPDSSKILLADGNDLYLVDADGSGTTKLPAPVAVGTTLRGVRNPDWRPDGSAVSFVAARADSCSDVYTMALDGSDVTRVTAVDCYPEPNDFAWAPDGTSLVFSGLGCSFFDGCENEQVFAASVPGGPPAPLTEASSDTSDGDPAVSPDGAKIAFDRVGDFGTRFVWVMKADGTGETKLTSSGADHSPSWQP